MSCLHVHDFIKGTMIALPRASTGKLASQEGWDILRPNGPAIELVLRHSQMLEEFDREPKPELAIQ